MDHQFFFSLSFNKHPSTPSDSAIHTSYFDYIDNDGTGKPNFTLNNTPRYSFTFNSNSAFEDYKDDSKGCLQILSPDNYIKTNNRFDSSSFTLGFMYKITEDAFINFMGDNHCYLSLLSWNNGDDLYEIRLLDHLDIEDNIEVTLVKNKETVILRKNTKYDPDKWKRIIYSHSPSKDIVYLDGRRAIDLPAQYNISFMDNIIIGLQENTLNGIYQVYMDDVFLCNKAYTLDDFVVLPYKRFIDLYPENDPGYSKDEYREDYLEGTAPNFYSNNKTIVDEMTDRVEITRPVYYHKPLNYKTDETYKYRFDRESETSASNFVYLDKNG